MMGDIPHFIAPLAVLAALVVYSRVARRMKLPKPVYWTTMIAGVLLSMRLIAEERRAGTLPLLLTSPST